MSTVYYKYSSDKSFEAAVRTRIAKYEKLLKKINVVAQKAGLAPIEDRRPEACMADFSRGIKPDLAQLKSTYPNLRVAIVILPNSDFVNYRRALSSIIVTTGHLHDKLEIVIVADGGDAELYRTAFEGITANFSSKLTISVHESAAKQTLFQEMMEIAEKFTSTDVVVFLTAEVSCTVGWLEALLHPILSSSKSPLFVAPYFEGPNKEIDDVSQDRISFDWHLKPRWAKMPESLASANAADEMPTMTFLPDAFAVNRKTIGFAKLMDFIRQNKITDTTSIDASLYSWSCLQQPVLMAPCSKMILMTQSAGLPEEFEPAVAPVTKRRIAEQWLADYFNTNAAGAALKEFQSAPAPTEMDSIKSSMASCKPLRDVAKEQGADELLVN